MVCVFEVVEATTFPKFENGDDFALAFPPKIDAVSDLVGVVNDDIEKMLPPDGAENLDEFSIKISRILQELND